MCLNKQCEQYQDWEVAGWNRYTRQKKMAWLQMVVGAVVGHVDKSGNNHAAILDNLSWRNMRKGSRLRIMDAEMEAP